VTIPLAGCAYYRTADVLIGGQSFHLLIDSGSTTLAVSADPCDSCVQDGVEELYDRSHGTDMGIDASGRYDIGELGWSGRVYFDTVSMGGLEPVGMRFVAVSDQDSMFGTYTCDGHTIPVDGILGLRQDAVLAKGTDSYLTRVVESADVDNSFALRSCPEGGTLWLGGYDESATTGPMSWVSFASSVSYSVYVTAFEVVPQDGEATVAPLSSDGKAQAALLDSGGPSLLVPKFAYDRLVDAIAADPSVAALGNRDWFVSGAGRSTSMSPDEIDATFPRFMIHVGVDAPTELTLDATQSYLFGMELEPGTWRYWPNLVTYDDFVDLGNIPMNAYVVYTDRILKQIGFAPAARCE
jgi:hypothetical protein